MKWPNSETNFNPQMKPTKTLKRKSTFTKWKKNSKIWKLASLKLKKSTKINREKPKFSPP